MHFDHDKTQHDLETGTATDVEKTVVSAEKKTTQKVDLEALDLALLSGQEDASPRKSALGILRRKINDTGLFSYNSVFEQKRDVDKIIEANQTFRTKIRKDVKNDNSLSRKLPNLNDNFTTLSKVSEGGQGVIFTAEDKNLERLVAIKSLRPEFINDQEVRNHFIAEAKVTSQLDHPAIVPVYTLCEDSANGLHLSMKLINGQTLKEYLEQIVTHYRLDGVRNFDEEKSIRYRLEVFLRVCDAMSYAHHRNVMHCDLKPENMMIGEYRETYIMDWGIARLIKDPAVDPKKWVKPKKISGTPRFLSPEAINGEYCDERADIYALGLILFETVTLKYAYNGTDGIEVMRKIKSNDMEPIEHRFGYPLDQDLVAIIRKATAYNRNDRYQSVNDLAEDLRRYLNYQEVSARPDNGWMKCSRWFYRHRKVALSITFFLLFIAVSSLSMILVSQVRNAIESRNRDRAVSSAYTRIVQSTNELDQQVRHIEEQLTNLSISAAFLLKHDIPADRNAIFHNYRDLQPGGSAENHLVYSPFFGIRMDLNDPVYKLPPGANLKDFQKTLSQLNYLKSRLLHTVLASGTDFSFDFTQRDQLKNDLLINGLPIKSAMLGLDNGLHVRYPGIGIYQDDFDPRNRPWYRNAARTGKTAPVWSMPYLDLTGGHPRYKLSCSRIIQDDNGNFLGVACVDVMLNSFLRMLKKNGSNGSELIDKFYITPSGDIILSAKREFETIDRMPANDDGSLRMSRINNPDLLTAMHANHYGINLQQEEGKSILYVYSFVPSTGWFYVEKIDFDALLNRIGFLGSLPDISTSSLNIPQGKDCFS